MHITTTLRLKKVRYIIIIAALFLSNHLFLAYKLPNSNKITEENSNLPSNHVSMIFIDSLDNKWIATDKGLSQYYENVWVNYADSGYFKSNRINDIAYETTTYGRELWIATDSGLTVSSYTIDGITGATTYHPDDEIGSTIMDWKVDHVVVDTMHNRWATTASAISLFKGSTWDKMMSTDDAEGTGINIADVTISDVAAYNYKNQVLFATKEKGVLRNTYNEVDGITGASTFGQPWAAVDSDHFNAIDVKGQAQWYGTAIGSYFHPRHETKSEWYLYDQMDGLVQDVVQAIHIDQGQNVWMGTHGGLSIYTADEKWFKYTEVEGLVNNTINNITSDMQGNVWVSTQGGIEWFSDIPGVEVLPDGILSMWRKTESVQLYPNPNNGQFNVVLDLKSSQEVSLKVLSVTGQVILSKDFFYNALDNNALAIDLSDQELMPGILLVQINTSTANFSQKLIISN